MDPKRAREHALATALRAHGYPVRELNDGIEVRAADGVTDEWVRCFPRPDDANRLWYYDGHGKPLAEADRLTDALTALKNRLNG